MEKWKMYMDIYQMKQQGFKIRRIARKLGVSRTTVYKYLEKSPEEIAEWMASTQKRKRKLDQYELLIHTWLSEHPDLSGAQVHDWLKERYPNVTVGESTVRGYVKEMREKYNIPKEIYPRSYEAVPELPMGQQAQVDFGQTKQKTANGQTKKLYVICFVLSHSRYKYAEWLDRPFTTKDVMRAHENAFAYFGGAPIEIVYDQDALIVVSENGGDLILTEEFQKYHIQRKFQLYVCRKSDPESKGKVENSVKFIKQNFAKNRVYRHIDQWNEQSMSWLERTGNGKVHNTTKKKPAEVFSVEKRHLKPITKKITISPLDLSIARTVRKDNTVLHESNRYSVPLGTYNKQKEVYVFVTDAQTLQIRETKAGPIIAEHKICEKKGELIQETQHKRDRSKGIPAYMVTVSKNFTDERKAMAFLKNIQTHFPRYIRDQLKIILKAIQDVPFQTRDEALKECINRNFYSATEFKDMVTYIEKQRCAVETTVGEIKQRSNELPTTYESMKPKVRELDVYLEILEGAPK
ncbi:IS21 family transposase [Gracilibacillus thailandensis]|uniref:IS21 family transposase n=1 Tax=Gracilibacillus thailandensis TaxID=563735 RepID=A0A6N7QX58_9BACI|nr:IS21 family transposase [Gracilibacillus thailandensis]MRI66134.1 IS21 family transposase [Gracilibacillus thailandensis]